MNNSGLQRPVPPPGITRRTLLRGAGVALALPFLESLLPRAAAAERERALPSRAVFIYTPHGVCNEQWYPRKFGDAFPDTPTLVPLQAMRAQVSLLSGLSHQQHPDGLGHAGVDVWLTGRDPRQPRGISVDQVLAGHFAGATRFPSLQIGTHSGSGSAQAAYTLSFNAQGIGLPAENDPRRIFQRLFSPEDAARPERERRLARRASVLDAVLEQSNELARQLGTADRDKLGEYLQSVREVEQRIERSRQWLDIPKPAIPSDAVNLQVALRENKTDFLRTMYELIALALETDSTRVVTFVTAPEGANSDPWPEEGLTGIHHGLQHHNGKPEALAKLAAIDKVEVELLTGFLKRLAGAKERTESLLDRTLILYGSGMNNGTNNYENGRGVHGTRKLPLILAGGTKLGIRQGRHFDFPRDATPMSNLFVSLLQQSGIERETFLDSTGTLTGLA